MNTPDQPQVSPRLRTAAALAKLVAGVVTVASTLAWLFLYASPAMVATTLALVALATTGLLAWTVVE